ncbi:MAG: hypothetical protein C0402_07650 [Thermodesulfovibrio sp.]|nr:hypothetical protein [Thermodesulfovibrio sp.]
MVLQLFRQEVGIMKNLSMAIGLAIIVLFAGVVTADARDYHRHGFRGGVIVTPAWSPGWYPYSYPYFYPYGYGYGYPYGYPYGYGYREPSVVIERSPDTYIEQNDTQQEYYWYYCDNPKGYYPYIKRCPDGWKRVLPTPPPSDGKE